MEAFLTPMQQLGEFEEISTRMAGNRGMIQVTGCIDSQKPHFIYCAGEQFRRTVLLKQEPEPRFATVILTYNDLRAKEIYENYRFFDRDVLYFPAKDLIFFQADIHSNLLEQQRIAVLKALIEKRQITVVTTVAACMNHLVSFEQWKKHIRTVEVGDELDIETLKTELVALGYERTGQVEGPGQFAVRGGIIDIYPLTEENPVRIELWGEEVDSLRSFDAESQRSIENMDQVQIYPAAELIPDARQRQQALERIKKEADRAAAVFRKEGKNEEAARIRDLLENCRDSLEELAEPLSMEGFIDYFFEKQTTFLDYFDKEHTLFFVDEPNRVLEAGQAVETEFRESMQHRLEKGYVLPGQSGLLFSYQEFAAAVCAGNALGLCTLENARAPFHVSGKYSLTVHAVNPYNNSFEFLVKDLKRWKQEGYRVILMSASRTRGSRLAGDLLAEGLTSYYTEDPGREVLPGEILITYGHAQKGYEYPLIKFVVISESDIFGQSQKKRKKHKKYDGKRISSFTELSVGDFVVHENHGLGVYRGIEKVEVDRITKDYMKIEYAGGSNLYVPATQLDVIQKYADGDAKPPKLNKLGTQEWSRTKSRVKGAVRIIAQDLVDLYAQRQNQKGFAYSEDTVWQHEFEEMFPFEETEDQLTAIEAVKQDMQSTKIMDRLICGDVGYGKTEIAIRAAFKAVQDGKQVAYLVPTTILAQQHYNTFVQRMKDFPVRVDLMCRFRTAAEQKHTITDLKKGMVDIVVGTHRLLSKDVQYKDLGLLIIDEEQRFGVAHKEKLKQLKKDVDVITLTATPIPRTLHMSLIGIRDMSVLEEAPQERVPIQTYVMEYNEEMVREAICRELSRGGQVYYVYNRVNSIVEMTNTIANLVPQAHVGFAHGQMKERELEAVMYDFINGDIDVLVTTTIIETGLDISNVNTMIIHDADNMGLSQLYQLRGRVGRSNRTSYAFLMYRRNKMLKEIAEKRLSAIREFTELGSGFKIAMRDLEIRGAGNLLGSEQHGHMAAVGYDLYCKLLNESVKELQGMEEPKEEYETVIDLDVDAHIPDRYISNEFHKLDTYKRIAGIQNEEEYDDMLEELMDRFGELPRSVQNLLMIARLRALAHDAYITELTQKGEEIRLVMYEKARIDTTKIDGLLREYRGRLKFKIDTNPYFLYTRPRVSKNESDDIFRTVRELLEAVKKLCE
ncbi:transcription-repair coupling factor [Parablautia sp. Marseille-Q6255]|uniref:transcription-repair coupling factor n=1 Tax=Parablautia sp. Marseille-Q6255 TaxID=3039593 RepID=UPI0024BC9C98|nr:transcription-repair coupling factor [Parablautia sp. Marseille-Q6255]